MSVRALILAFAILASGCAAPADLAPIGDSATFSLAANAMGCSRALLAVPIPIQDAQAALPRGFVAGDLAAFFGASGATTGRGVALAALQRCDAADLAGGGPLDEARVGVFVATPRVGGVEPVRDNLYEIVHASTGDAAALARAAWPRDDARVEVAFAAGPPGRANASASDGGGAWLDASADASAYPDDTTYHVRWWRDLPRGLAWADAAFHQRGQLGPGACRTRDGSAFARLIGATTCPSDALTLAGPPFDVEGRLEARAGLRAS